MPIYCYTFVRHCIAPRQVSVSQQKCASSNNGWDIEKTGTRVCGIKTSMLHLARTCTSRVIAHHGSIPRLEANVDKETSERYGYIRYTRSMTIMAQFIEVIYSVPENSVYQDRIVKDFFPLKGNTTKKCNELRSTKCTLAFQVEAARVLNV